ncbi:shikimate dehydrogenase [Varunaivibrio sulfuroxidans]|uniref:Shikimate dehydrogenase (NADP(+)) n=1 Tax=Varunaivibrio sulfuroxidans TaxID=1773489 RepID=A0A4R3JFH7_9PROT|nr:shikimate dehydrogenase [Varunaivibrio sulfuroxidans]TCS64868.1 shikimate dehydrogenase [Varunaivibrio sulfuroxidans]WES29835.1 shikimate dehydrogenase [Varunaivibrio sulfuroxidans]
MAPDNIPPSDGYTRAGVVGWPVNHSLSPRVHGYWLEKYAIKGDYVRLATPPEDLKKTLRGLEKKGFRGVNITVPHKENALKIVDCADPAARRIGAVNTIVVGKNGRLEGSNTDGFGFLENLKSGAPRHLGRETCAVVLGAGGAARAVVVALLDQGVGEIRIVNRTRERAQRLIDDVVNFGGIPDGVRLAAHPWSGRNSALDGARVLVNTTVLGMNGRPPLAIELTAMAPGGVVNDIVYSPLTTPLLTQARARGLIAIDGLGMLLHQARPGFRAWFGAVEGTADGLPTVDDDLRAAVLKGLEC